MATKGEMNTLIRKIQADLQKALDEIKVKHGYVITFGGGSYDNQENFTCKLIATKNGALSAEALFYKQNHIMLGLPPLNTEILYGGRNYIIVGINKTGTRVKGKYNDKIYLLPVEMTKWKL
jgi:hypothetical protein